MSSFLRLIRGTAHYSPSGISDSLRGCHPIEPHYKKNNIGVPYFHNGFYPKLQDEKTKVCRTDIFGVVEEVST